MTSSKSLTVPATEFKAHCLELMDRVRVTGLRITVTKHGKPVAQMVPIVEKREPLFGSLPVKIIGDIVGSTGERWESED
jgi:prevent-host-death family protein